MLLQMALFHSFQWLSNILLYMCATSSLSLICQQIFRLLPCLGYCKQHYNEHWGACIFLNHVFLHIYGQEWDCWIIWQPTFQVLKETLYCPPYWLYQFINTFLSATQVGSLFSTPSPAFIICRLDHNGLSDWCQMISHCSLYLHFSNNQ